MRIKIILYIFIIFLFILSCRIEVISPGIGTSNLVEEKKCSSSLKDLCRGKLFSISCNSLKAIRDDLNNDFQGNAQAFLDLNQQNCDGSKDIFLFEDFPQDRNYQFTMNSDLPTKEYRYKYEYVRIHLLNSGYTYTFPKQPESNYREYMTNSASPVDFQKKEKIRFLLFFEKFPKKEKLLQIKIDGELKYEYSAL